MKATNINVCDVAYATDGPSYYEIDPNTEEYPIDIVGHVDLAPGPSYPSGPCPVLRSCDPVDLKSPIT